MRGTAFPELLSFGQSVVYDALERLSSGLGSERLLVVDATCGNGHDTLFLARTLNKLRQGQAFEILAFDVQEEALRSSRSLLEEHGLQNRVEFLLRDHAELGGMLEERRNAASEHPPLAAVMFNLGFLPRSDKRVITQKRSTLASLYGAARLLAPGGVLSVHAYGGHPGGAEELEAVDAWCAALPFDLWIAARYGIHNKPRAPETLFLVQKREKA